MHHVHAAVAAATSGIGHRHRHGGSRGSRCVWSEVLGPPQAVEVALTWLAAGVRVPTRRGGGCADGSEFLSFVSVCVKAFGGPGSTRPGSPVTPNQPAGPAGGSSGLGNDVAERNLEVADAEDVPARPRGTTRPRSNASPR